MIRTIPFNFSHSINKKHIYNGVQPAITGIGGFSIDEELPTIKINPIQNIGKYNVTNSIQILFDVATFNRKLGLVKDNSNNSIIRTTYCETTHSFPVDSISIPSCDFIKGLRNVEQINSLGKLDYIYQEFTEYVNDFLNYEEGFTSIYMLDEQFDISGGKLNIADFYHLLKSKDTNAYGTYYNLFGNITLNGVNKLFKSTSELNIFGNRGIDENETQENQKVYSIRDGFLDGDLIFIPKGFTITLSLELDSQTLKLNELGKKHVKKLNEDSNFDDGNMSQETITTIYNITRIIKVPLFIKLINDPYSVQPLPPPPPPPPPPHVIYPTPLPKPIIDCSNIPPPIIHHQPTGNIIPPGSVNPPQEICCIDSHSDCHLSDTHSECHSDSHSSDSHSSDSHSDISGQLHCFPRSIINKRNYPRNRHVKTVNITEQLLNGKSRNENVSIHQSGNRVNIFINNS